MECWSAYIDIKIARTARLFHHPRRSACGKTPRTMTNASGRLRKRLAPIVPCRNRTDGAITTVAAVPVVRLRERLQVNRVSGD
jgi:hypothetical protein